MHILERLTEKGIAMGWRLLDIIYMVRMFFCDSTIPPTCVLIGRNERGCLLSTESRIGSSTFVSLVERARFDLC